MEESGRVVVDLFPAAKRSKSDLDIQETDFSKCIICQKKGRESLSKGSSKGIMRVIESCSVRKDDVFDRLQKDFNDLASKSPVWHPNCYKCYTSKHNLELLEKRNLKKKNEASATTARELPEVQSPTVQTRRTSGAVIDWSKCFTCQKVYYKKDKHLVQVITFPVKNTLKNAAEIRNDEQMKTRISYLDLIAYEAKFQKNCYQNYTSKSYLKYASSKGRAETEREKELGSTFKILLSEIEKDLSNGKVFEVSSLLQRFKELLLMNYPNADPNYRSEKLKKRLKNHFTDEVVFIPSKNPTKSDYVMSSSVTIRDAAHSAAKLKEDTNQALFETNAREFYNHSSTGRILYHASKILKKEMKSVTSVDTAPIDSSDITAAKAESMVPDAVYMFLKWLMTTDLPAEDEKTKRYLLMMKTCIGKFVPSVKIYCT